MGEKNSLHRPHFQKGPPWIYYYGERVEVLYIDLQSKKEYFLPGQITDWVELQAGLESVISVDIPIQTKGSTRKLESAKSKPGHKLYLESIPPGPINMMYLCPLKRIKGVEKRIRQISL